MGIIRGEMRPAGMGPAGDKPGFHVFRMGRDRAELNNIDIIP